jgi:hypothetical protein
MRGNKWPLLLIALLLLSIFATGCGAKDLVSLAGLDKADLYVGDRYGNRVKVDNSQEFLAAFKSAKLVKDPKDARSEVEAEYVFYSGESKVYYDAQGKYLIFIDKGNKNVYSADIDALLAQVSGLPPVVTAGFQDDEISEWLETMSQVDRPVALLFKRGDQAILAVMAGQRPREGYKMNLENVSCSAGELTVDIRLVPPEAGAEVVSYPVATFTLSKFADVNVRLIEPGTGGDDLIPAPVSVVEEDQNIVLLWPERGSILTERVRMTGFASIFEANFIVEVEDGHNVLGIKQVTASEGAPGWGRFDFWIDLEPATSPYGTIIFVTYSAKDGSRVEELMVPVGFGGK